MSDARPRSGPSTGALSPARRAAWRRLGAPGPASFDEGAAPESDGIERRDRAAAERLVKGVLQHRALIDALIQDTPGINWERTAPKLRDVLRIAVYEKIWQRQAPDYAIGAQAVELGRVAAGPGAAKFVNAAMRRLMERLPADEAVLKDSDFYHTLPEAARWSVPEGIIAGWRAAYGRDEADAALAAMSESIPAVWLRANKLKISTDDLAARLEDESVEVERLPGLDAALQFTGGETRPWETRAWAEGLMTVQDAGAMLAGLALGAEPGMSVLDYCAAPGGKTGHIWEQMRGEGRLVAWEPDETRRRAMTDALARLYGAGHAIEIPSQKDEWGGATLFDRVLVDAPCLALGLIRRHPEIRWDNRHERPGKTAAAQRAILEEASAWVKLGGRLLWVTCSPTLAENEDMVQGFLEKKPDWRALPPPTEPAALPWTQARGCCLRTRPDVACCDGFAMMLVERGA